jgi:hypothetical protein
MSSEPEEMQSPGKWSWRQWCQFFLPEARMRVATRRIPRDWFELLTRIPIIERIVIKRFVENLMCEQWVKQPHQDLQGMDPLTASKDVHGRALLETLLRRMAHDGEKTPRELRRIRHHLGM